MFYISMLIVGQCPEIEFVREKCGETQDLPINGIMVRYKENVSKFKQRLIANANLSTKHNCVDHGGGCHR